MTRTVIISYIQQCCDDGEAHHVQSDLTTRRYFPQVKHTHRVEPGPVQLRKGETWEVYLYTDGTARLRARELLGNI